MATQTQPRMACKVYQFPRSRVVTPPPPRSAELLGRVGYGAIGVVYLTTGALALRAALVGGRMPDTKSALAFLALQPFGELLLWVIAVGLDCYVVWRLVQALIDPERIGGDARAIMKRTGIAVSGLGYAVLSIVAARLALGTGGSGSGQEQEWTARVLSLPLGVWLVGLAGLVVAGIGLHHFRQAYQASFMKQYDHAALGQHEAQVARRVGRFGLASRGVTFLIIGWFLGRAALRSDPSEAHGLGDALLEIVRQPYGVWLLAVVAAGLGAYGLYCFTQAGYRRFARR